MRCVVPFSDVRLTDESYQMRMWILQFRCLLLLLLQLHHGNTFTAAARLLEKRVKSDENDVAKT